MAVLRSHVRLPSGRSTPQPTGQKPGQSKRVTLNPQMARRVFSRSLRPLQPCQGLGSTPGLTRASRTGGFPYAPNPGSKDSAHCLDPLSCGPWRAFLRLEGTTTGVVGFPPGGFGPRDPFPLFPRGRVQPWLAKGGALGAHLGHWWTQVGKKRPSKPRAPLETGVQLGPVWEGPNLPLGTQGPLRTRLARAKLGPRRSRESQKRGAFERQCGPFGEPGGFSWPQGVGSPQFGKIWGPLTKENAKGLSGALSLGGPPKRHFRFQPKGPR